jgi:hypothetical protein
MLVTRRVLEVGQLTCIVKRLKTYENKKISPSSEGMKNKQTQIMEISLAIVDCFLSLVDFNITSQAT